MGESFVAVDGVEVSPPGSEVHVFDVAGLCRFGRCVGVMRFVDADVFCEGEGAVWTDELHAVGILLGERML